MKHVTPLPYAFLLLIALMLSLSACATEGDDLTGPDDEDDTTAPTVVSTSPVDQATGIAVDALLQVVFSEDMYQASFAGVLGVDRGVAALNWLNAHTVEVEHDDWVEGSLIDIVLDSGFIDVTGNPLEKHSWSFHIETTVPFLESSLPPDLATNLGTNMDLILNFSTPMNLDVLGAAITAVDDANPLVTLPVQINDFNSTGKQVYLDFADLLPANATITVTIDTSAESLAGIALTSPASFSFTTGTGLDNTPPSLVGVVPASGTTISANTPNITFTFDEIMDPGSVHVTFYSAQFLSLFGGGDVPGEWSIDAKILTIPLPGPLPAGIPLVLTIDRYEDIIGNQQQTPIEYRVDVAGDADVWPFVDGTQYQYDVLQNGFNDGIGYFQIEQKVGSTFHWSEYSDASYTNGRDTIIYSVTPAAITQIGETYFDDDLEETATVTPGVDWARMPFEIGTWDQTASVAVPEGTLDFSATITVVGLENVPSLITADFDTEVTWLDCWKVNRSWELKMGANVIETGEATHWYAPSIGVVKTVSSSNEEGLIESSTKNLLIWRRP